jgi:thioredoxin:protein disulfide reductase
MLRRFSALVVSFSMLLLAVIQLGFVSNSHAESGSGFSLFTDDADEKFLHPDEAFQLNVTANDSHTLTAKFTVTPGYYLYKDRIQFEIKEATSGTISAVNLPAGDIKDDPNFGRQEVYHHDFVATININKAAQNVVMQARFQGCSEKGLCYAPQLKTFNIDLSEAVISSQTASVPVSEEDEATSLLKSGKLWLIAAGFFGFGLLLSFTPCVLPMIPIFIGHYCW